MTAPQDPFRAPDRQPDPYGPPPGSPGPPPDGRSGYGQPAYGTAAPGSGGYGHPGPGGYGSAPAVRRNGLGTTAVVLGVLALLLCWTVVGGVVLGIAAIVLGVLGRGRARRGEADNGGLAVAGAVLGLLGLLASLALVAAGLTFLASDSGRELQQCLEQARGDAAAEAECQSRLQDSLTR